MFKSIGSNLMPFSVRIAGSNDIIEMSNVLNDIIIMVEVRCRIVFLRQWNLKSISLKIDLLFVVM